MNINSPLMITFLYISLDFSIMYGVAHAADKKTIIGPTKSPLSIPKTIEIESVGNRRESYGRGYSDYNNNYDEKARIPIHPKTTPSLQRKALPDGTKALSPTNTRTPNPLNRPELSKSAQEALNKKTITTGVRSSSPVQVRKTPSFLEAYERNFAGLSEGYRDVDKVREYLYRLKNYWAAVSTLKTRVERCKDDSGVFQVLQNPQSGTLTGSCSTQHTTESSIKQCYERAMRSCLSRPTVSPATIISIPVHMQQPLVSSSFNSVTKANNRVNQQRW